MSDETTSLKDIEIKLPESILSYKLYNSLSIIVTDKKIDNTNVILITTNLMQIVEEYPGLKGEQKKTLIIDVLKRFVIDNLNDTEETFVLTFIDSVLPYVIDTIISVDKKEIAVKMKKSFKVCFPSCFK